MPRVLLILGIASILIAAAQASDPGPPAWVEVDPNVVPARSLCDALAAEGILTKDTHGTVLRFAPPLTITRSEIDWAAERIERVFARQAPIERRRTECPAPA